MSEIADYSSAIRKSTTPPEIKHGLSDAPSGDRQWHMATTKKRRRGDLQRLRWNHRKLHRAARRSPPPDHTHESAPGGITVLHKTCRRLEHATVTTVLFLRLSKYRFCPSDFPNGRAPVWQWLAYRWASTGCTAQKRIQVRLHGWPANGSPRRIYPHKAYKQTALISIEA